MIAVRHLLARRHLAALLCAATLLVRLLVPAGYMIGGERGRPVIELCAGMAAGAEAAMPAMPGHDRRDGDGHARAEMPCPFAGLSVPALGAAGEIELAALVAFILAVALRPARTPAPTRRAHLRPPLRAPPATC